MKNNIKRYTAAIMLIILAAIQAVFFSGCGKSNDSADGKVSVVATNFAMYDLARAVCGDLCDVTMLLKPGSESHDFEATLGDIAIIAEADIILYVGGESEEWMDDVIASLGVNAGTIRFIRAMDHVETLCAESEIGGHSHDHDHDDVSELDEHVWTSIDNAVTIMDKIRGAVISEDVSLTETVTANYAAYKEELIKLDEQFKDTVKSARRNMIIVADRFPFQYLTEKYGIEYVAAFSGCSSDTEPTLSMINYLIEQVKLQDIPAVLKIEFSDGKTAEAVASETGCGILELHSAHNVTTEDFDAGVTYADLMRRNLETLRVALN